MSAAHEKMADLFADRLRRRQLSGSLAVAVETGKLLRNIIGQATSKKDSDISSLKETIAMVDRKIQLARPTELAGHSMISRVLRLIKEEEETLLNDTKPGHIETSDSIDDNISTIRAIVRQGISEIIDEFENSCSNIANQALEHIHSNEIILTIGNSPEVDAFLKEAARVRKFQVIIAESAPGFQGHNLAVSLSKSGIDTTVINDAAVFAVMSRVNKVILGAHAVTVNGGLVNITGCYNVAIAASSHSVPLVVLAGLYALSPTYPYQIEKLNSFSNPDPTFKFHELNEMINLINPEYDYIPPGMIALYITNVGPHPPKYIKKLVNDS